MLKALKRPCASPMESQEPTLPLHTNFSANQTTYLKQSRHMHDVSWTLTPQGEKRGYIQPQELHELWIHTGTVCNLACPFCFEGASINSKRLAATKLSDIKHLIDEALDLQVKQFSFTGGEPFMNKDFLDILDYCLEHNPCLVLTNATKPLAANLKKLQGFTQKKYPLSFRVSIDFPDEALHDKNRGAGNFALALKNCAKLHGLGFTVSIAAQAQENVDKALLHEQYKKLFIAYSLPENTHVVFFPDLLLPFQSPTIPFITEHCMTTYKTAFERDKFMCAHSAMLAKKDDTIHIYPCTLVDDDDEYNMGQSLKEALEHRIMLKHHRCFACFSSGTSCSEL